VKYQFIKSQRTHFKVVVMCRVLEVSRSGFYDWLGRPESCRTKRHRHLTNKIRRIHFETKQIYGSPRIRDELVDQGEKVGVNTVAHLMRKNNIQSKVHKCFIATTDSRNTKKPAENILNQEFDAQKPNQKWVSDVTFIPTGKGWLFLATVMDLYSRRVIGWAMSNKNNSELTENALKMACTQRGNVKGVLLHSDQGNTYSSATYQKLLHKIGAMCSMSRKGNCWDNAPMESFFHSLKTEWVVFEKYQTRSEARSSIFSYIELFYNRKRRHSSIGNKSPMAFEAAMAVP
jgi:putative transposase